MPKTKHIAAGLRRTIGTVEGVVYLLRVEEEPDRATIDLLVDANRLLARACRRIEGKEER